MDLFPTIDVTAEKKTKAVLAICGNHGYEELDGEGEPKPSSEWSDNAEMLAFFRAHLIKWLNREYQVYMARQAVQELPSEASYDLGVE